MPSRSLVLVAVLCLAVACGSDGDTGSPAPGTPSSAAPTASGSPTSATPSASPTGFDGIEVVVANGRVVNGVDARQDVRLGSTVRIKVVSDVPDEVHVHGYDETFAVGPGAAGIVEFRASIPGSFEVELHDAELVLFQLRVR